MDVREHGFPCCGCGASLEFAPGASALTCPYCGTVQEVEGRSAGPPPEYDFEEALARLDTVDARSLARDGREVSCTGCGAMSVIEGHADRCAFCDSPVVLHTEEDAVFPPETLLPFSVDRERARAQFSSWLGSLWFAPSGLQKQARSRGMDGVYLPFWTYDADVFATYTGARGEYYYVTERYTDSNGKSRTRRKRMTRWYPVQGSVDVSFDDVLVRATSKLPDQLVDKLEPWDLAALTPFDRRFLSGFTALRYDIDLEQGFGMAKVIMRERTELVVRSDIGGDTQRVYTMNPVHRDVRFKHFLLPAWVSSFRYGDRVFRFLVNARTGEVVGERPWSVWKILGAALVALLVLGVFFLLQGY